MFISGCSRAAEYLRAWEVIERVAATEGVKLPPYEPQLELAVGLEGEEEEAVEVVEEVWDFFM
jgi:hypothetical protein